MVRLVNLPSVIVERKCVFIVSILKTTFLPDKFRSVSYIQLKLVDECLEKCLHLHMAMHLSNPLVCLHVCLHSERASSELDLALDKQSAGAGVKGAWQLKRGGL